jgi:hypothetical protein
VGTPFVLTRQGQREEGKEEEMGGKSSKNDFSNQVVALLHSYIAHCGAWLTREDRPMRVSRSDALAQSRRRPGD